MEPPEAQPEHPVPDLRRFHGRSAPQGSGARAFPSRPPIAASFALEYRSAPSSVYLRPFAPREDARFRGVPARIAPRFRIARCPRAMCDRNAIAREARSLARCPQRASSGDGGDHAKSSFPCIRETNDPRTLANAPRTENSPPAAPPTRLRCSRPQVEEFYVLTWEAPKEMIFEMPVRVRASRRRVFFRARRRRVARGRRRRRRSARVVVRSILDRTRRRSRVRIIARSARVPTTRRRSLAADSASEKTTPRRRNPRCPRNPRAIAAPFEARRPSPLTF